LLVKGLVLALVIKEDLEKFQLPQNFNKLSHAVSSVKDIFFHLSLGIIHIDNCIAKRFHLLEPFPDYSLEHSISLEDLIVLTHDFLKGLEELD
jgi:hypothetical protein